MPQSLSIGAFAFGAVLILLSLGIGKFKLFGAEVEGKVGRVARVIALLFGVLLVLTGLSLNYERGSEPRAVDPPPNTKNPGYVPPVTPQGAEANLTQQVEDYMTGQWKFRAAFPSATIISTYEMEFLTNGKFSGTRSVGGFAQDFFSGTWSTVPSSSSSFTLTLSDMGAEAMGADPKSLSLRVINRTVADGNNGSRWFRQ